MSPRSHRAPIAEPAARALARLASTVGQTIHDERVRRHWTLRGLAGRAGVSTALVQRVESGEPVSLETYARVTTALDLRAELLALDPRQRQRSRRGSQDFVHAAMGELEAGRFRSIGFGLAIDEPYQHYQFAGRADVVAWDLQGKALLHIENRTAFPNVQEAVGSYGAKRSYLAGVLAERLGIAEGRWRSVTHVMASLWSAEVVHAVRLRSETFRAVCPDSPVGFRSWWDGRAPETRGVTSTFVLLDPAPDIHDGRRFGTLDDALRARPRYRGYADAVARLQRPLDTAELPTSRGKENARRGPITRCSNPYKYKSDH